jgi:hypothetical protein
MSFADLKSNSSFQSAVERSDYIFANREEEQLRLERQAELFDPLTERLFQTAVLRPGARPWLGRR